MLDKVHFHVFQLLLRDRQTQHPAALDAYIVEEKTELEVVKTISLSAVLPQSMVLANLILVDFPSNLVHLRECVCWVA